MTKQTTSLDKDRSTVLSTSSTRDREGSIPKKRGYKIRMAAVKHKSLREQKDGERKNEDLERVRNRRSDFHPSKIRTLHLMRQGQTAERSLRQQGTCSLRPASLQWSRPPSKPEVRSQPCLLSMFQEPTRED